MKDLPAQLIHDMQNTAMVLRETARRLHEDRDTLVPRATARLTEVMARRSDMLIRLLRDLSTAHLAERGELDVTLQRVSLADICEEMLVVRRPAIGVRTSVDVADDAVVVADPLRVTQVLDNLVTNAHRYGGPHVHVAAVRDGGTVRLSVSDDGTGVPDDLRDTLFEGYAHGAASPGAGGSGLGLLIVRQLCSAMGGTVEYDDTEGTCFTVTLPGLLGGGSPPVDDVAPAGHSVVLWSAQDELAKTLLSYVARGLVVGEAVVVAATRAHHDLLEQGLAAMGIDPVSALGSGQYIPLDAEALHDDLATADHVDRERFDALIGDAVREVASRWSRFRVFGEIVDLYWRRADDHLALELEACWDDLRAQVPFPLLCGYELTPEHDNGPILDCHDAVVPA